MNPTPSLTTHYIELIGDSLCVFDVRNLPRNTVLRIIDHHVEGREEGEVTYDDNGQLAVINEHWSADLVERLAKLEQEAMALGWTDEQFKSAMRVCRNQEVDFHTKDWLPYDNGDYIGRKFEKTGIFIGIEKDGYAHS